MIKKILLTLLLTALTYSQQQTHIPWCTLANSDWPMIKHDPQFTGRSPYNGPQTGTIIWTADLEDGIFSGPVLDENRNLYFGTYYQDPQFLGLSDYFYCYDSTGNFIWDYKLGRNRPPQTGIVIDSGNTIYFGSLDGYLYALNTDGTLKWEFDTKWPIFEVTIPNIDLQNNIYISNAGGQLYSINPNGTENWNVTYESGFFQRSPAISPDGNTIYIAGRDSNLYALNLDGSLKWKLGCGIIQRAPMIDSDGNIYFIPYHPQYFFSLNPEGVVRWQYPVNSVGYAIPTIDKEGNIYIISNDTAYPFYQELVSLTYNGNFRWKYIFDDEESDDFWQPLICDSEGTVYVGSTFGSYFYAISKTGQLKWKIPMNYYQVDNTGAITKDGTLYLGVHKSSLITGLTKTLIAIKDTGVVRVKEDDITKKEYSLLQNYPNPFNPTTNIEYQLKAVGFVSLKVYDILGREVANLVNETQDAGQNSVVFNAANLPSGIYFYRIKSGSFSDIKKMLLVK